MDIEAVDSTNTEAIEYQELELNTHPNWNGRYATSSSMCNISHKTHILSQEILTNIGSSEPKCLKADIGGSAGADPDGHVNAEVHVEGTSEEKTFSYEVKGTVSVGSDGNTKAEISAEFEW